MKKLDCKKAISYLILLGFILGVGQALQQISLIYTDVANTGVFTVMYVLIVPFMSYFIFSKKIHWSVWPAAFFCVIGGLLFSTLLTLILVPVVYDIVEKIKESVWKREYVRPYCPPEADHKVSYGEPLG